MLNFSCHSSVHLTGGGICHAQTGGRKHLKRKADYWVLIFVRDKSLHIEVRGVEYEVKKDQVLFLPAGQTHQGTQPYPEGLVFYWLHFVLANSDIDHELKVPRYTTLTRPDIMVEIMRRCFDDRHTGRSGRALRGHLYLCQMLLEIEGNHRDTSSLPETSIALTFKAEAFIRINFHLDISTATLAEEMGCCPDHLGRIFRAATGSTLTASIQQRRIEEASQLLIESNLGIDQIGYQVGFKDRAYFRKIFKRLRQCTPSTYRKLHTKAYING
jgi:AraC-like DNA-binding protein